jgi:type II secretory pathway component PulF
LNGKIRTALLYPGIVVLATGGITAYLLFVLLPQITPLFTSMNLTLPLPTRIIIWASDGALAYWHVILGTMLVTVVSFFVLLKSVKSFRFAMHALSLRLPVFGSLLRKIYVAQFAQILGTLLKSGITIIDAIKIAAEAMNNDVYRKVLQEMAEGLQQGASLSTHFTKHQLLFPPLVSQMISVGEETGKLDESFLFISKFSEREVDEATKNLTTILEPLLMLVIGGMVGFIAIAIISPIYQLTKGVQV